MGAVGTGKNKNKYTSLFWVQLVVCEFLNNNHRTPETYSDEGLEVGSLIYV
jgi:hypothetical protein